MMSRLLVEDDLRWTRLRINSCRQPCMSSKVVVHGPDPRCSRASTQMGLQHHDFVYKTTFTKQRRLYCAL